MKKECGFPISNTGDNKTAQRRGIDYAEIYADITDQVLLMNLVAREKYYKCPITKSLLDSLHRGYVILLNINSNKTIEIPELLPDTCSEKHTKEEFLNSFFLRQIGKNEISNYLDYNCKVKNIFEKSRSHSKVAFSILQYVCEKLDKRQSLSKQKEDIPPELHAFLFEKIFGELKHLPSTCGYGHANLYLCLYHFKEVKDCYLLQQETCNNNSQQSVTPKNIVQWLNTAVKVYNIANALPNPIKFIRAIEDGTLESRYMKFLYKFAMNKTLLDVLQEDETSTGTDTFISHATAIFQTWLTALLYSRNSNLKMKDPNIGSDEDLLFVSDYKMYKEYRRLTRKGKNSKHVINRIDAIPVMIYAILTFDFYKGALRNVKEKVTIANAMDIVEKQYYSDTITDFPKAGVKRQLHNILNKMNAEKEGYCSIQRKLDTEIFHQGTYISYPHFRFIDSCHTDE